MFPFFLKIPSTDMSARRKTGLINICERRGSCRARVLLTHLLHRSDDVLDEGWDLEMSVRCSQDRIRSGSFDELIQRYSEDSCRVEEEE